MATKAELIDYVADRAKLTKSSAGVACDAILDFIKTELKRGEPISLVGFGSFERIKTAARDGRNPRTGEPLTIPAGARIAFKASKRLREQVA